MILVDKTEVSKTRRQIGPATSMTPSTSAFSRRAKASRSSPTSVALAPTDLSVIEAFVAELAVEALDESVLRWLARRNMMKLYPMIGGPA